VVTTGSLTTSDESQLPWWHCLRWDIELINLLAALAVAYLTLCAHRVFPAPYFLGIVGLPPDESNLDLTAALFFCCLLINYVGLIHAWKQNPDEVPLQQVVLIRRWAVVMSLLFVLSSYTELLGITQNAKGIELDRRWPASEPRLR
jgi:hypothetical protein